MKNIYYSPTENFLFWIAGYTEDDNTCYVTKKVAHLMNDAIKFANHVGVLSTEVMTMFVEKSSRFERMRVFYIEIGLTDLPEDAQSIGDQTMFETLHR